MGEGFGLNGEVLPQKIPKTKLIDDLKDDENGLSALYHTFVSEPAQL